MFQQVTRCDAGEIKKHQDELRYLLWAYCGVNFFK